MLNNRKFLQTMAVVIHGVQGLVGGRNSATISRLLWKLSNLAQHEELQGILHHVLDNGLRESG